ncbi:MAG TPA: hypothetical protein ENK22_01620, partial [Persephonella sp.]|nr:hypothetical protein [Persephonella sp.]
MKTDILQKGYITLGRGYEIKQDGNFGEVGLIKITDAGLSTHVHVLGATGAGKTLLLKFLDTQFLYNGYSLIKLDMKFDEDNFRLVYALSHYLNKPF